MNSHWVWITILPTSPSLQVLCIFYKHHLQAHGTGPSMSKPIVFAGDLDRDMGHTIGQKVSWKRISSFYTKRGEAKIVFLPLDSVGLRCNLRALWPSANMRKTGLHDALPAPQAQTQHGTGKPERKLWVHWGGRGAHFVEKEELLFPCLA